MASLMLSEIREIPALVEAALRQDASLYADLGRTLRAEAPSFAVTVARGSSDHAASYAGTLFGLLTGRVTASLAPSMITRYGARLDFSRAFVLGLSQSGASPDLARVMRAAEAAGAVTAAIVNQTASPLTAAARFVLPQHAGTEQSVAATKSFVLTLIAAARLAAIWAEDRALEQALPRLPERLHAALTLDWGAGLSALSDPACTHAFVVGRGPGLAIAGEAALKLKETARLHAEAVSAAEIQHGPRALLDPAFPVLAFALNDPGGADVEAFAASLAGAGGVVLHVSAANDRVGVHLPLPAPLHPLLDPIVAVTAFYPFAEALTRARGGDPDHPRGLRKITETF